MVAAARRLNYSQSAISMQLRRLEEDLGAQLLHRDHRGIRPTRLGQTAARYAREMLRLNHDLRQTVQAEQINGIVRFGLPADLAPMLRSTWARFAALYPGVQMEVRSELSVTLMKLLDEGTIDLAVVTSPTDSGEGTTLRREPMVWVGAHGTSAHQMDPLPLAIGPEGGCEFRKAALKCLDDAGRAWRVAYQSQAFAALSAQVNVGLAIAAAMPSMVSPDLNILDAEQSGLPALPAVDIRLCCAPGTPSTQTRCLAEVIMETVG